MTVDALAAAAALRGASGVRAFLFENRSCLRDLLAELATPTLLEPAGSLSDARPLVALRIETLPLSVQRELWSTFVKWRAALPADALLALVDKFLIQQLSSPSDAVSVYLAEELRRTLQDEDSEVEDCGDGEGADAVHTRLQSLVFLPTLPKGEHPTKSRNDTRKRRRESEDDRDQAEPSEGDAVVEVEQASAPNVSLQPETEARVSAVAAQLVLLGSPEASVDQSSRAFELASHAVELLRQVMNQVHATQQDNEALFHLACAKLQLSATSDDVLFQVTNGLMDANWSSRYAAIYLGAAVLPRVLGATSVISRVLLQTILLYAKPSYATALTEGLLVPLLSTPSIGSAQGEAATRLLREKCVPMDEIDALLQRSLDAGRQHGLLTNEPTLLVYQNILNMKPILSPATVELLVSASASALEPETTERAALCKSPKFASLVFTLVTKYSAQCSSHAEELQGVASQLTSVMAKSTLHAIQKLKN